VLDFIEHLQRRTFIVRRLLTLSILIATTILSAAQPITWSPRALSTSLLIGTSSTVKLQFTSAVALSNIEVRVVPELAPYVSTSPVAFATIQAGMPQTVSVQISVPKTSPVGVVSGTIQLRNSIENNATQAEPLSVSIQMQRPTNSSFPTSIAFPSPDRLSVEKSLVFVRDEIDVHFLPQTPLSVIQQVITAIGGVVLGTIPELDLYQIMLTNTQGFNNLTQIISQVQGYPSVEFATHNTFRPILSTASPNDQCAGLSYDHVAINLPQAWGITTGATGSAVVPIAVVDNVFDFLHPDLVPNIAGHFEFTGALPGLNRSHGTRVASIIGAKGDNAMGIAGAMWSTSLLLYSTLALPNRDLHSLLGAPQGEHLDDTASQLAILQAINAGTRIINFSAGAQCGNLGNEPTCNSSEGIQNLSEVDLIFARLFRYAKSKGLEDKILWVFAVANNSGDLSQTSPARLSVGRNNVVSVSAVDQDKKLASFSGYGTGITVAAPGVAIYSDTPGGGCDANAEGTSFATPLVAGVAGLMLSVNPDLTAPQIKTKISTTAKRTGNYDPAHNEVLLLDAFAAVQSASPIQSPTLITFDFTGTVIVRSAQGITDPGIGLVGSSVSGSLTYQYPPPSPSVNLGPNLTKYDGLVKAMSLTMNGIQFNSGVPPTQSYAAVGNNTGGNVSGTLDQLQFTYEPLNGPNSIPYNLYSRNMTISLNGPNTLFGDTTFPVNLNPVDWSSIQGQIVFSNNTVIHPELGKALFVVGFNVTSFTSRVP
jgi:thermitase